MQNQDVYDTLSALFRERFGRPHRLAAYAPGRVEVLGNHTDYNEGFVLSAAINFGTFFAVAPRADKICRLAAGDVAAEVTFTVDNPAARTTDTWANYVIGVVAGLRETASLETGFDGMFLGNVPLGAGLSSSAALEMCSGLALSDLYGANVDRLTLAKIGQAAEHRYAGVKCGLLDQITSLFGRKGMLVMSDFRTLDARTVPFGADVCFLMCNTRAVHALVDGAYNERRRKCQEAADYFAGVLPRDIRALRDVTRADWEAHAAAMDPVAARRAAHIIGENERVLRGRDLLAAGDLAGFGRLMFESHESSTVNFENSCAELDAVVDIARKIPGVLGARLSGGGFGGSAVILLHPRDAEIAGKAISTAYRKQFGHDCDIRELLASDGATLVGGD